MTVGMSMPERLRLERSLQSLCNERHVPVCRNQNFASSVHLTADCPRCLGVVPMPIVKPVAGNHSFRMSRSEHFKVDPFFQSPVQTCGYVIK